MLDGLCNNCADFGGFASRCRDGSRLRTRNGDSIGETLRLQKTSNLGSRSHAVVSNNQHSLVWMCGTPTGNKHHQGKGRNGKEITICFHKRVMMRRKLSHRRLAAGTATAELPAPSAFAPKLRLDETAVGCGESLCENSISDHRIRLHTSSKCVISQIGAKFSRLREFSHSLAT